MSKASQRVVKAAPRAAEPARSVLPSASFAAQPGAGIPAQASLAADRSTAERLGHNFGRVAVHPSPAAAPIQRMPVVGGGGVIQCEGSDDDPDWLEDQKKKKVKPSDPNSEMVHKTLTASTDTSGNKSLQYETTGGAHHKESFDASKLLRTSETSGLKFSLGYRNDAIRPTGRYKYHNHVDFSTGQFGLNQAPLSHDTPSWLGMRAGGDYGNGGLSSHPYNRKVESEENKLRKKMNKKNKFRYKTVTQEEKIAKNPRAKEIAQQGDVLWDEARIQKRLNKLINLYPNEPRIVSQNREIFDEKDGTSYPSIDLGVDFHYGLPARAYNAKAKQEYKEARLKKYKALKIKFDPTKYDGSSEESDSDLYEKKPPWHK